MGSSKRPAEKWGLSTPSYSNLESMNWAEEILEGSSGGADGCTFARKTGLKSENGRSSVAHSPFCTTGGLGYTAAQPTTTHDGQRRCVTRSTAPFNDPSDNGSPDTAAAFTRVPLRRLHISAIAQPQMKHAAHAQHAARGAQVRAAPDLKAPKPTGQ